MGEREQPITATGQAFFHATEGGETSELNTRNDIALSEDSCRWNVSPLSREDKKPELVDSTAPEVRRYVRRVLTAMQRQSPRPVRAVPKPITKRPKRFIPPTTMVPCPLCKGESWVDCEVCEGDGAVTARQAERFLSDHDD